MSEDQVTDTTQAPATSGPEVTTTPPANEVGFTWKNYLNPDYKNSPTIQNYQDNPDGFNNFAKQHLELEKMLGHEKVPVPKGAEDVEGWNRFAKAMGVPDKADGYGLQDAEVPESMKGLSFNKQEFSEIAHSLKLTPSQTKTAWEAYTNRAKEGYAKALQEQQKTVQETINRLRGEWGDAYETNVQLGQDVINKFSGDQETNDYITAALSKDPRGIKFLAQIGNQFAENKISGFEHQRFSLTAEQAQAEIDKIVSNPQHPYNNDRAPQAERDRAIDYVNSLYKIKSK